MQKVLTAAEMREVDRLTTEKYGIPSIILMENAAHATARVITEKLGGSVKGKSILILCGKGNNGGDGAALARLLYREGAILEVYLFGTIADSKGDARTNFAAMSRIASSDHEKKGDLYFEETPHNDYWVHTTGFETKTFDVIVDALFGTGLSRELDTTYSNVFLACSKPYREDRSFLISVDMPSGLLSDSAVIPDVHATSDCVVTFTSPKPANVLPPSSNSNGELIIADIGSPRELIDAQPSQLFLTEKEDAAQWLYKSQFSDDSYKNKRGHALLIAGSENYSGAAVLAGNAAMRSGVGLVTLAAPKECKAEIASRLLPDVILTEIDLDAEEPSLLAKADAIAVGCGLSATDPAIEKIVRNIVSTREVPVIIDAGALWFFSPFEMQEPEQMQKPTRQQGRNQVVERYALADARASAIEAPLILTPHEGEFLRLLGTDDKDAINDRVAAVREFSQKHNVILVLKGERVLIGEPGGKVVVNPTGNSGLGKAGNGDTLTGILTGFVAQAVKMNIDIFETVVAAVYIAGMAGDAAEKKYGKRVMTASDVRECLTDVFAEFEQN